LRAEGIQLECGVAYKLVRQTDAGASLTVTRDGRDETLSAERLLVATGRAPNVEGLGLRDAGVAQETNGSIRVDDRMRTTRSSIYAAGDVTGHDQFVYMAAYGAKLAAKNALNGGRLRYDNKAMPAVVFTDPQVASVGLTEAAARTAGYETRVSVLPLSAVPRALAARDSRGLIKFVADKKDRKLLGAHILAPEGSDSIQTAALAIRHGLTIDDLADAIFPYLTTVEGLKLAALGFDRDVTKLSCCAG
jgi:mercuric reductase